MVYAVHFRYILQFVGGYTSTVYIALSQMLYAVIKQHLHSSPNAVVSLASCLPKAKQA
jgi:hypothetical protein